MYCAVDLGKHLLILKRLYHFVLKTFWLFVSFFVCCRADLSTLPQVPILIFCLRCLNKFTLLSRVLGKAATIHLWGFSASDVQFTALFRFDVGQFFDG